MQNISRLLSLKAELYFCIFAYPHFCDPQFQIIQNTYIIMYNKKNICQSINVSFLDWMINKNSCKRYWSSDCQPRPVWPPGRVCCDHGDRPGGEALLMTWSQASESLLACRVEQGGKPSWWRDPGPGNPTWQAWAAQSGEKQQVKPGGGVKPACQTRTLTVSILTNWHLSPPSIWLLNNRTTEKHNEKS